MLPAMNKTVQLVIFSRLHARSPAPTRTRTRTRHAFRNVRGTPQTVRRRRRASPEEGADGAYL